MPARQRRGSRLASLLALGGALVLVPGPVTGGGAVAAATGPATATDVRIEVLSGRADLVTGGDALVEVTVPAGASATAARVTVAGRDVTRSLRRTSARTLRGLVTGLVPGPNVLRASLPSGRTATLTLTDHSTTGPVFAGPQVQPWVCDNAAGGNGPAQDASCTTPPTYTYQYKDLASGTFQAYDPASPPPDATVARTTTDQGRTVRYVVRVEHGTQDRGNYLIGALVDPATSTVPTWNHKLVVPFGASTGVHHGSGAPTSVLDDAALSRGFVVADSSLHVQGQNANHVVAAEALVMLKERIVEQYGGPIRYTIGNGCSGGAIMQYVIAGMYPGLLDGIQPNCAFEDIWTTGAEVFDCNLLLNYFDATSPQLWADDRQRSAVDGHLDQGDCRAWDALFSDAATPSKASNCALPADQVYDRETRPAAVRCTIQDYQQAVWGPRRPSDWGPVEKGIGKGFAKKPTDNVGVQYGLTALNAGTISPEQFVDLNAKVGGLDIDNRFIPGRNAADAGALSIAYRAGQVTDARQLRTVPIIDLRGYSEVAEIHTSYHSYRMRARLDERNGTHANQLIWTFSPAVPIAPTPSAALAEKSFLLLDEWLTRIEGDTSGRSLAQKVLLDKPAGATDGCFVGAQQVSTSPTCDGATPPYSDAMGVAGGPATGTVLKCRLKPLDRGDYRVPLTDEQVTALRAAFPTGVCDYSKPGVGEQPSVPWLTFAGGPGGAPLGPPPVSRSTRP